MTKKRRARVFAASLLAALAAGRVEAQTAPPDPLAPGAASDTAKPGEAENAAAPKHAKPKPRQAAGLAVTVNNKRSVGLVELTVAPAGDANPKKVAGPLAFGRKTVIHLKRTKDCLYDVRGHFADEADTEQLGVELCKDKVINLTDE
jgi:hypothetical protein